MDPKELFARMKQFAQEQEAQVGKTFDKVDNQFKLSPGYTQNAVEGLASTSGGIRPVRGISEVIGRVRSNNAAVTEFEQLKKAIQERGYGRQLTDEELLASYPKDPSVQAMEDAKRIVDEKLRKKATGQFDPDSTN